MKKRVNAGLILIITALLLTQLSSLDAKTSTKNILVIHSYAPSMNWVEEMNRGLQKAVQNEHSQNLVLTYEFLDAKRYHSKEYFHHMALAFKFKYSKKVFDAVIVCDDHAFDFINSYRNLFLPDTPVFFCGVNDIYNIVDEPDITGIYEANPILKNFQLISQLLPNIDKILVVADSNTRTNKVYRKRIESEVLPYITDTEIELVENLTFKQLEKKLANMPPNQAVLYFSYIIDSSGEYIPHIPAAERLLRRCNAPIFTINYIYLHLNVIGGYVTDPKAHAETVAVMATDYLRGIDISLLEPDDYISHELFPLILQQNMLTQFGIDKSRLPESAIVNDDQVMERIKRRKELLYSLIIIIFLILILGYMLYIDIRNRTFRRKNRKKISFWDNFMNNFPGIFFKIDKKGVYNYLKDNHYSDLPPSEINDIALMLPQFKNQTLEEYFLDNSHFRKQIEFYSKTLNKHFFFLVIFIPEYKNDKIIDVTAALLDNSKSHEIQQGILDEYYSEHIIMQNLHISAAVLSVSEEDSYIEYINPEFSHKFQVTKNDIRKHSFYSIMPKKTGWLENIRKAVDSSSPLSWNELAEHEDCWLNIHVIPINNLKAVLLITDVSRFLTDRKLLLKQIDAFSSENKRLKNAMEINQNEKETLSKVYREKSKMAALGEFFITFSQMIDKKLKTAESKLNQIDIPKNHSEISEHHIPNKFAEIKTSLTNLYENFRIATLVCEQEKTTSFDLSYLAKRFSDTFENIFEQNNIDLSLEILPGCKCRGDALDILQVFLLIMNDRLSAFNRISDADKFAKVSVMPKSDFCRIEVTSLIRNKQSHLLSDNYSSDFYKDFAFNKDDIQIIKKIIESNFNGKINVMQIENGFLLTLEISACLT